MGDVEEIQSAIDIPRQEAEPDSMDKTEEDPKKTSDYLDLILQKNTKLSGIIDCIRGFKGEAGDEDLGNLGWAMHDFTDAIEQLIDDLWNHLENIGALQV